MKIENMSYEEAMEELEKIIKELEDDNLSLKDSMDKFKQGMSLYKYCNEIINNMEGEIKILMEDKEGLLKEEDFPMEV